jgi:hypothetical protein
MIIEHDPRKLSSTLTPPVLDSSSTSISERELPAIPPQHSRKSNEWLSRRRRKILVFVTLASVFSLLLFVRDLELAPTRLLEFASPSEAPYPFNGPLSPLWPLPTSASSSSSSSSSSFIHSHTDSTPAPLPTTSATKPNILEPVIFILLVWSEPSAAEAALLIKVCILYFELSLRAYITIESPSFFITRVPLNSISYAIKLVDSFSSLVYR